MEGELGGGHGKEGVVHQASSAAQSAQRHQFMAFGARGKPVKGGLCICTRGRRIKNGDHRSVFFTLSLSFCFRESDNMFQSGRKDS